MLKISIDGIEIFVEDTDHYLQTNDICGTDIKRIWEQIETDYKNYDKWFCYHNLEIPYECLRELGAVLADDNIEMRLTADNFICYETLEVERITDESFDDFAYYHDSCNPGMYWTSERIKRDLSRWCIFTLRSANQIEGYILLSIGDTVQSEIFCVEAPNKTQSEALISSTVKYAFDNGRHEVLFMADADTINHEAALSVGFTVTGFYKSYTVKREM